MLTELTVSSTLELLGGSCIQRGGWAALALLHGAAKMRPRAVVSGYWASAFDAGSLLLGSMFARFVLRLAALALTA